jgi:GNAT superfamily N-acetyltransferase
MQIRLVDTDDAAAVNELLDQLGYAQDDAEATAARIRSWRDDPASAAYVAETDSGPLGVVAVHTCPFFERPGSWGRIVALVVSEKARGQGIGAELVSVAESFAKRAGCVRMEVTSGDHREDAHEFYRRRGYVKQTGKSSRFLRTLEEIDRLPV